MSNETNPKTRLGAVVRPPTASTPLWTHFLNPKQRPATTLADIPGAVPPPAPLDKTATSVRILLHDTQANLEKFGTHVRNLLEGVTETKQEIKTANSLFERDRESFIGDITDLINRCQREIQKAVGSPAQEERIHASLQDFSSQLTRLDQRLDAFQTFNQTHSQALQTQIQATQILLDKQGTIIAAVLPLLPLLQALPLYIDAAKNSICEHVSKAFSSDTSVTSKSNAGDIFASTNPIPVNNACKRKRADSHLTSSPLAITSPGPFKRQRSGIAGTSSPSSTQATSPLEALSKTPSVRPLSRLPPPSVPSARTGTSVAGLSLAESIATVPLPRRVSNALPPRNLATPRRPLSDLLPAYSPKTSRTTPRVQARSASGQADIAALLLPSTSAARNASAGQTVTPAAALRKPGGMLDRLNSKTTPVGARVPRTLSGVDTVRSAGRSSHSRTSSLATVSAPAPGAVAAQTTTAVATPAAAQTDGSTKLGRTLFEMAVHSGPGQPGPASVRPVGTPRRGTPQVQSAVVLPRAGSSAAKTAASAVSNAGASNPVPNVQGGRPGLPNSVIFGSDRRSPMRERRRFIPLVDSEDEEEEE